MRIHSRLVALFALIAGIPVLLLYYIASNYSQIGTTTITAHSALARSYNRDLQAENDVLRKDLLSLQTQLSNKNCTDVVSSHSPCEVIHVGIVCAGYNAARDLATAIKSILFYRKNVIHFHLIVDSISLPILNTLFETWDLPSVHYSFYSTSLIQDDVSWIPNYHYSGVYGLMKLQLPYVLPSHVHRVILLDTDIVLTADIAELWRNFDWFKSDQMVGLVENLSDWYLPSHTIANIWPAKGRGYNTGVMLMDLVTMKRRKWAKLWRSVAKKYLPEAGPTKLADQDVINAIIKDNPETVYSLPCVWNVQISNRASFEKHCYDTNTAKAVHFNSPEKYQVYYGSQSKDIISDYYKNIYFMFVQYDGNLLKHILVGSQCIDSARNHSGTTKPTISDYMERSPEISSACYKIEGIRQSSRGRLHLYYLPYNYTRETNPKNQTGDITLVTQLSIDRLGVLEMLCQHWTGPMSLALYLSDSEAQQFHDYVSNSPVIRVRKNIGYHIVFKTGTHYPVNYLRNVALDHAQTEYVFLTDIDFIPMVNMYNYLREACNKYDIHNKKIALVIPAFETQQYRPEMPYDKEELKKYVDKGQVQIFRYDVWPQGHAPTNYSRWFESSQPYKITWQPNYEPYIAVSRELVPKYDERFFGFGWNKVSHIMELDAQGFSLTVVPSAYIMHSPHAPSLDISQFRSSHTYRKCVKTLKKEFQKDLSRRYGIRALKYLSND